MRVRLLAAAAVWAVAQGALVLGPSTGCIHCSDERVVDWRSYGSACSENLYWFDAYNGVVARAWAIDAATASAGLSGLALDAQYTTESGASVAVRCDLSTLPTKDLLVNDHEVPCAVTAESANVDNLELSAILVTPCGMGGHEGQPPLHEECPSFTDPTNPTVTLSPNELAFLLVRVRSDAGDSVKVDPGTLELAFHGQSAQFVFDGTYDMVEAPDLETNCDAGLFCPSKIIGRVDHFLVTP